MGLKQKKKEGKKRWSDVQKGKEGKNEGNKEKKEGRKKRRKDRKKEGEIMQLGLNNQFFISEDVE